MEKEILTRKRKMRSQKKPRYLPTPEKIAEETAKIRAGWSDKNRCRRDGLSKDKKDKDHVPVVCWFYDSRNTGVGMEMVEGISVVPADCLVEGVE